MNDISTSVNVERSVAAARLVIDVTKSWLSR